MKSREWIVALALSLLLAACGGAPQGEAAGEQEKEAAGGGRVATIDAQIAAKSGIRVAPAGPATIADEHVVQGMLVPMEGRVANVTARFPGPVRRLTANVGDAVKAGQVLAVIESNLSLSTYEVTTPISGVVLSRNASVGSVASESSPLYEIVDLASMWVDLPLYGSDAQHIRAGSPVEVTRLSDGATAMATLDRVLPGTAAASQSTVARATIANKDGMWRPGSAVTARVTVDRQQVELAVPQAALQVLEGETVVFVRKGDAYEAHAVEPGKRDARQVQVLAGIVAGDEVVVEQSYLIKAEIEKASAAEED